MSLNFVIENEDAEFQDVTVNGTLTTSSTVNAETNIVDQIDVEDNNQNLQFRLDGDATTPFFDLNQNQIRNMSVVRTAGAGSSTIDFQDAANSDQTLLKLNEGGPVEIPNGDLLLQDGARTDPSLSFAADTDTGFYRNASGQVSLSSNGTETLRIDEKIFNANGGIFDNNGGEFRMGGGPLTELGGETDAGTGAVRLANNSSILARNSGDTGDFGITFGSSDAVEINNSDLRLATGQAIEDGSGTDRLNIESGTTQIDDETGAEGISLDNGVAYRYQARSGTPWEVFDNEGNFRPLLYSTSSSAPGTLELENADLQTAGENEIRFGGSNYFVRYDSGDDTLKIGSAENGEVAEIDNAGNMTIEGTLTENGSVGS